MSTELDVVLHGAAPELPADQVLTQLQSLVSMMGLLEDSALHRDRKPSDRSTWTFNELGLGSVHARLRPLALAPDASEHQLERVPVSLVEGFGHAEHHDDLPVGWGEELAGLGRRVAAPLDEGARGGMMLTLIEDGEPVRTVDVTRRAAANLKAATHVKRTSLGSVIGTLAAVNTRRSQAGLWTELDDRRVSVAIDRDQLDVIGANLDQRVLVAGTLTRNAVGQVLSVRADEITPWPRNRMRLSESNGLAAGHLGDEGPVDHLERVGGWAT